MKPDTTQADETIRGFIQSAKEHGASDEFLVALLRERGWPTRKIYRVLGEHYTAAAGIEIPEAPSRLETAREAFFHLLAFSTLLTWVLAIGSIWFMLIANWYPEANEYVTDWTLRQISWQMSSIIVAFPAFLWATLAVLRDISRNPEKAESGARRWLTNLALLLTALIFIGDLVCFVTYYLEGGVTTRFALKSAVVFVLAGAVFLYYNRSLAKAAQTSRSWHAMFGGTAGIAIGLTIALGFQSTGSPDDVRIYRQDAQRLHHLNGIAQRIISVPEKKVPADLNAFLIEKTDPFRNELYGYRAVDSSHFELCAVFEGATRSNTKGVAANFWRHPAGPHCFTMDVTQMPPYPVEYP